MTAALGLHLIFDMHGGGTSAFDLRYAARDIER
jgi:hypothetical protein